MPKHIAVAVDGSDHGFRALDTAAGLAAATGAKLTVVHVLMHGRPGDELARMMEVEHMMPKLSAATAEAGGEGPPSTILDAIVSTRQVEQRERLMAEIGDYIVESAVKSAAEAGASPVDSRIETGDYADGILNAAKAAGADLIVIGSRGLGQIREWVLGSVSHKVCQNAECSVLVAR